MPDNEFSPLNPLEETLLQASREKGASTAFYDLLLGSKVFVLIDKPTDAEGRWDPSINICVLTDATGVPVLAVFTAPERSAPWHERLPEFGHGLLVDFTWVLKGLREGFGIIVNPGNPVGVHVSPEVVAGLKRQVAGN